MVLLADELAEVSALSPDVPLAGGFTFTDVDDEELGGVDWSLDGVVTLVVVLLATGGVVLAMSAWAMWQWSLEP